MTDMGFSPDNPAEGLPQLPTDLAQAEDAETSYRTPNSPERSWWARYWWLPLLLILAGLGLLLWGLQSCGARNANTTVQNTSMGVVVSQVAV